MKQIKIFTDGSSRGNPGPGGWGAIIFFMEENKVREIGGREKNTTNNRMELTAVIRALEYVRKLSIVNLQTPITIYTDSSYVLRGAKDWSHIWQKSNWKTKAKKAVLNQDLWKKFVKTSGDFETDWHLLKGHSGISANERCDEIATAFAVGRNPKLFSGILHNYKIDLSVPLKQDRPKKQKSKNRKESAYSYVSLVGGIIKTHKNWTECEKRVKGKSGAKFKKSYSPDDEESIKSLWRQGSLL